MYNEVNVFGLFLKRGQLTRLSFDSNMHMIHDESKASFVIEVTLGTDGTPYLRQAGASRESGLVLTGARGGGVIRIGSVINLIEVMRSHSATLKHPARPGSLEFRPKGFVGKGYILELHWWAGDAITNPVGTVPHLPSSNFFKSEIFDRYAAKGWPLALPGGLFHVVFAKQEDAVAFGRYTIGFPRRVMPNLKASLKTRYVDAFRGYVAELTLAFPGWEESPGWAEVTGVIVCNGGQTVALGVESRNGLALLPIRAYSHTMRTSSGTFYVLYEDGSGFCRSQSEGALTSAGALFFADHDSACRVYAHGGAIAVSSKPRLGLAPVYVPNTVVASGGVVTLKAGSFRRGTRVVDVKAA